MARLTCLFIYLFIFLISLLATGVVTGHCYGLSRGNIKVFVDSAGGFWSKLIGFFFFPEQFMYVLVLHDQ